MVKMSTYIMVRIILGVLTPVLLIMGLVTTIGYVVNRHQGQVQVNRYKIDLQQLLKLSIITWVLGAISLSCRLIIEKSRLTDQYYYRCLFSSLDNDSSYPKYNV